jgi:Domain of unknown function (DUF5668)
MTDPLDETQPHDLSANRTPLVPGPGDPAPGALDSTAPIPTAGTVPPPPGVVPPVAFPAGMPGGAGSGPDLGTASIVPPTPAPAVPPPPGPVDPAPALRANPDRPATDWREPPWIPPRTRDGSRDRGGPSLGAIVVGLVLLAIGLYYFIDRTLGISLPAVRWGSLWPLILVVIGAVIVLRAISDRR